MSERISDSAAPALTADEMEARIEKRRREMNEQPCYRCGHANVKPDLTCVCCRNAHTPNMDGEFDAVSV